MIFLFFVVNATAQPLPALTSFNCEPEEENTCIQSQCDAVMRPRISTHPNHPVNIFNPARLNAFDWRQPEYPVLLSVGSSLPSPISSPFYQGDNGNVSQFTYTDRQDMRPEDGWEVLKYDFGGVFSAEGIHTNHVNAPYLVLYNRFLSKMRVFVARGVEKYKINYCNIYIYLRGNNKSSILDLHHGYLRPLDMPFISGDMQAGARVLNIAGKWSYAEFPMVYDPCTCEYNDNSLIISINNVELSTIALSGTIQGTIVSRNSDGVSATDDGFTLKDVTKIANHYVKGYAVASKFIEDSKKIIDNTSGIGEANADRKKAALTQLGRVLNSSTEVMRILRGGLQAVPYVTFALSMYDMFTAGGTSTGPQKVEVMPMALNATVKLAGEMKRTTNYNDITFMTPGSKGNNVLLRNTPYYNEILGVFNLLETPQINRKLLRIVENSQRDVVIDKYSYWLASPIKYVINPASGLEIQDVQAAFILRNTKVAQASNFSNQIGDTIATTEHVDLFNKSPFGELTTFRLNDNLTSKVDKDNIWLQLILNLRRKDGNGENVLLVVTYPTVFVETGTECNNCFEEVSRPEIRQFCTDANSVYRQNRISAKQKPVETVMQPTIQHFKAFPNPVDNQLHLSYDSETEQTVKAWLTDVTGRMVSDVATQKVGKGNYNLDLPTQTLPEGLHLLIFEANGIQKVQKVVIRH